MSPSAVDTALQALGARDRTSAELDAWLSRRGIAADDRGAALATLARAGYLDDARFAHGRARVLAERAAGDALIRSDLGGRGVPPALIEEAVDALEPERGRARRILRQRGFGPRALRYLVTHGFDEDMVESLVAQGGCKEIG